MFISSQVLRVSMQQYTVEVLPFLGAMIGVLLLTTIWPEFTLWLPNWVYGVEG
jgi:TRAP-type C4-dicarboxylate transport system permease large subunit